MEDTFALLRYDFAYPGTAGFEIIDNVLGFIQLRPVFKDWKTDPVAKGIANAVGCHGIVSVVNGDFFRFQVYLAVGDFCFAE